MGKLSNKKRAQKHADIKKQHSRSPADPLELPHALGGNLHREWIYPVLVVGTAFFLRIIFFYLNRRNNPAFNFPIMDSLYHHQWANDIISGKFWGDEVFFRGPLYPYLLAFLYKISGSSITFAVFFQHLIGSLSCGLVYLLSNEYFSRRVSLLAGLFAALYWPFVFFEGELLIVTCFIFLSMLSILLLVRSIRHQNIHYLFAAGIVLGIAAITRPSMLAFFPAVPIVFYVTRRLPAGGSEDKSTRNGLSSNWVRRSVFVFATSLIFILPVMIRNYVVGRAFVPIASSGGINFYIGNNPTSDGRTAMVPGSHAPWWGGSAEATAIAERHAGRKLSPAEISNHYLRLGIDFILSEPDKAALLWLRKLRMFWSLEERSNDKFIYFFWHLAGMKYVPLPGFWLIVPLALLGGILQWRRRRELSILYLFVLFYMLGVVAFFVNARFRLPVLPVLCIFAAYAAWFLYDLFRNKSFRLLLYGAILLIAFAFVNYEYLFTKKSRAKHDTISYYTLGNAYLQMDRKDDAIDQYLLARMNFRKFPTPSYELISEEVNYKLGALYWERGNCEKTIEVLNGVRGRNDRALVSRGFLAECYLKKNQPDRSFQIFREMLDIRPGYSPALMGIARSLTAMGRHTDAEKVYESIVDMPGKIPPNAYLELAEIQQKLNKLDAAVESYSKALQHPGNERRSFLALADIYIQMNDYDQALLTLNRARRYFSPNDSTIERKIAEILEKR